MTTILVVDDSAIDRKLAGGLIEKNPGWNVIYAHNGSEALEQIELHLPDVVVTDLQMPVMNGLELVAAIKKDYPLIPVVLMTAQGSEEIAAQALKEGASYYVAKRKLHDELVEIIGRVIIASDIDRSSSRLLHRMTSHITTFVIENDLTLIPALVQHLQQVVSRMRLCGELERLRIGVALEEALLNSYYHGNLEISSELREIDHRSYYDLAKHRCTEHPYCDRRIYVEARCTPEEIRFQIRDEGPGFDQSSLADATDPANLERPCGRGVLLMRTFMDDVQFNAVGNEVTLVKRRSELPVLQESEAI